MHSIPFRWRAKASVRPPTPPPTIATLPNLSIAIFLVSDFPSSASLVSLRFTFSGHHRLRLALDVPETRQHESTCDEEKGDRGDGGDRDRPAKIEADWTVKGLHLEDTIAHFDTLDGNTLISPSNRVCVYAPRFGSVRLVLGVDGFEGKESLIRYDTPERVEVQEENLVANTTLQQLQTIRAVGSKRPSGQQRNSPSLLLASDTGLLEANGGIKPYENFRILRDGLYELSETAKLAERTEAATIWTLDKGIQIVVDGTPAEVSTGDARAEATFTVDHESAPGLRIVKVASTQAASPGEIVEFTLRYDNVGNEPLGNVTIIDNLTTRLEYVEGSQTASREARFLTQINEGDSLVLRWEITDPVNQGTGGTIRFQCRVR